jgi:hypothetical protein
MDTPATRPYIAVHISKGRVEVYATSSHAAQVQAAAMLKVKPNKAYEVSVYLADVTHSTSAF